MSECRKFAGYKTNIQKGNYIFIYSWPWTTWVWTVQVHLYADFLINILENFSEICNNLKNLADEPHGLEISEKLRERYVMNA